MNVVLEQGSDSRPIHDWPKFTTPPQAGVDAKLCRVLQRAESIRRVFGFCDSATALEKDLTADRAINITVAHKQVVGWRLYLDAVRGRAPVWWMPDCSARLPGLKVGECRRLTVQAALLADPQS